MKYAKGRSATRAKVIKIAIISICSVFVLLAVGASVTAYWYNQQLRPVNNSDTMVTITIPSGASVRQIAQILYAKGLIKNVQVFEWFVRNQGLRDQMQAGQYQLSPSQSVADIAEILSQGKVQKNLFTILPSQRLDQIKASLIKAGFKEDAVTTALDPNQYKNHPVLSSKPSGA